MFVLYFLGALFAASGSIIKDKEDSKAHSIPSFIKICHRDDPLLNECVKDSVEEIRPYLKTGIPELHIPSCEPLILPEVVMNQGRGSVTVQSRYTDLHIHGPTDFKLHQVKVDLDKDRVKIKLSIPKLQTKGNYTISGRILMLPISGSGESRGNYSNIEATALIQAERIKRDNKTYFHVQEFFVDFTIGHASVHLSNLFDGDKQLGDAMNEFLNDNWKNVAQEMKPVLEKTIGDLFKKFANRIYSTYPMDVLLPISKPK
ncbi:protein takeout [Halyomorpha halys]|uniref:protein takeout n=1 Tax=Halyomorpha halys TaxID=286706 RepID=UPI0006D51E5E|nr:protein takeout [Halyomorpha halys]